MASELSEILKVVAIAIQEQSRNLDRLFQLAETLAKQPTEPAAPKANEQEQEILDLWNELEDGAKLTTSVVSKLTGNFSDNGTLKRRLADMVRRGMLRNDGSGYYPSSPKSSNG